MRLPHVLFLVFLTSISQIRAQFVEISQSANINHIHSTPTLIGGGVCMDDFNRDGWDDFAVTGGNGDDLVYINQRDKTFSKYRLPHNRHKISTTTAVISGDFNNDTCPDLIYTTLDKSEGLTYLQGNCDGTFMDVSSLNEIDDKGPSTGMVVVDVNSDGLQDLYVLNYIEEQKFIRNEDDQITGFDHDCHQNILLINKGNFLFENLTSSFNAGGEGCALAATYLTVADSISGIYIANDFGAWLSPNEFLVYDHISNSFKDKASDFGLDIPVYGMGIALGDYDNDQMEEIYVTNIGSNYLLKNKDGFYVDQSIELNVENQYAEGLQSTSWGTVFFDVENDGDLDLFVSNGEITTAPFLQIAKKDPSTLFLNNHNAFMNVTLEYDLGDDARNRGVASGDIDHDGDIDLILTTISLNNNTNQNSLRYKLFENKIAAGNYLKIKLIDRSLNEYPFGAVVRIYSDSIVQQRTMYSSGTFASQNTPTVHFGVGSNIIDSIEVIWPSKEKHIYYSITTNQFIQIIEGEPEFDVLGCMDEQAADFNEEATLSISCADSLSTSVNELANIGIHYNSLVHDELIVSVDNSRVQLFIVIYDIYGKMIHSEEMKNQELSIDFSSQIRGTYFFKARTIGQKDFTGLFVKI